MRGNRRSNSDAGEGALPSLFNTFQVDNAFVEAGRLARLSGGSSKVLSVLRYHRNRKTGLAWPSIDTIAAAAGLNRGTVSRCLKELQAAGEIELHERRRRRRESTKWRVLNGCASATINEPTCCAGAHEQGRLVAQAQAEPPRMVAPARDRTNGVREPTELREPKDAPTPPAAASLPSSPANPIVMTFPCVGGRKSGANAFELHQSVVEEWSETFPAVDVLAVCRKAREWLRSNPKKIKTHGRMRGWISSVWLGRAQDEAGTKGIHHANGNGKLTTEQRGHFAETGRQLPQLNARG